MAVPRRILIVGAGCSGLAAIKACKEEGLEPTCYEKSDSIGGLWCYRDDEKGEASVAQSTVTNTSKEMTAFSDFPPPKDFPNYLSHEQVFAYLKTYAEKFDLVRHVRVHQEVVKVVPAEDYSSTGRWTAMVKDTRDGRTIEDTFEGVMICTGHYTHPNVPDFPRMGMFRGEVIHTRYYRKPDSFANSRVLVIGLGNSGGDVAVDLTQVAKKVYVSTRKGTWILSRTGILNLPLDLVSHRRVVNSALRLLPFGLTCRLIERQANRTLEHSNFGLKPRHRILNQQPTVNEHLMVKISNGEIHVKRDVTRFTETGVVFDGETDPTEIDVVVLATGYKITFPFLNEDVLPVQDNHVTLYKYVFPPHMSHPTLATIGLVQPLGSLFPVVESQSRWVAMVLNGKAKLPDQSTMMEDILERKQRVSDRYVQSPRHTIQGEWIPYMDEIASQIGAVPNFFLLAVTDPRLFLQCFFGPCLPYQYRLRGPHPWSGAREAILSWKERVGRSASRSSKNIVVKILSGLCLVGVIVLNCCGFCQPFSE